MKIKFKIIWLAIFASVAASVSIFFVFSYFVSQSMEKETKENIVKMQKIFNQITDEQLKKYEIAGDLLKENSRLIACVKWRNVQDVQKLTEEIRANTGAEFVFLRDAQGRELSANSKEKSVPDSVQKALQGQKIVGVVSSKSDLQLQAITPIKSNGRVVGVLTLGSSLANSRFVDSIKATTGLEATVFLGDKRLMTTIIKNGKRAVGTIMDNKAVCRTVLQEGGEFIASNTILGTEYETLYWPIKNIGGKSCGMWFIGMPIHIQVAIQKNIKNYTLYVMACIVPFLLAISWFVAQGISSPIIKATDFAFSVAKGNLDKELVVSCKDEVKSLAESLNSMVVNLKQRILESEQQSALAKEQTKQAQKSKEEADAARAAAEKAKQEGMLMAAEQLEEIVSVISSASKLLVAQLEDSDLGAKEQAERVGETATAMEEMNGAVLEVARNAGDASTLSTQAREKAESGKKIVQRSSEAMEELQAQSEILKKDMNELEVHAESISAIMSVISDIADQTNLLALNAAIEAARAGEYGRGFAVVADEVRKLAEKTMASTADVSNAITEIQTSAKENIQQVERTGEIVERVFEQSAQTDTALQEIVGVVDETSDQVRAIATASEEQSATSEEINRSITEINSISQKTSQAMHEAMEAVTQLREQTKQMDKLISDMKQQ